jgi:hypothetical protein
LLQLTEKLEEENKFGSQNNLVSSDAALTVNEICDYYNLKNPQKPINSDNLRKTYLNELNKHGEKI